MSITKKDEQDLKQIQADYGNKFKGLIEDYFALLYLTKKFKVSVEEISRQVSFGNKDYGIDSYYIDRETKNLYLYQFKWSENHNLFKESFDRLSKDGIQRIFNANNQDPNQNEIIHQLKADLHEYKFLIEKVYIQFVFKGSCEDADNSQGLQERKENLENKAHFINHFFGREIPLIVEYISDRRNPPKLIQPYNHVISTSEYMTVKIESENKIMHVSFVPIVDLYKIYQIINQDFFSRNIRSGLSSENPPNRKIRETLKNIVIKKSINADVFAFNHNGVTLAAEKVDFENGKAQIKVPRLINGAQTITSFAKFLEDNEGVPALKEGTETLEKIKVLTKIIVDDPHSDFVTNVTICNNQQNPVDPWNLRANDRIQCDIQDKMREEARIYYSRQEKSYENMSDDDKDELGIEDTKDIKIKPLAQTFLALQGEVDRMSRLRDVFENSKWYEDTFKENYLKADVRKIVIIYKVYLVINSPMQKLMEISSQKHKVAIRKARNLVWSLLIQGILNDSRLEEILDSYGTSLSRELWFRDCLSKIASSKILPIFKEIFKLNPYHEKIENDRYDFIKNKEFYKKCMDIAYEKWGWRKMSI